MSEKQAEYQADTDLADALEMLGAGYDQPSIEIELARTVMERRDGRMQEVERAAFVKISTSFKAEMAGIDEIALKVWLYIALSVNRISGKANPGIRTIAKGCNLDKDTVSRAVKRLEVYNLLMVDRESKKYNIYEPTEYVSANRTVPTEGTVSESVPTEVKSVPIDGESVPTRRGLNQRNQRNHISGEEIQKIKTAANKTVDGILETERKASGKSWSLLPEVYHPLARAFCEATGLSYHKKYLMDWIAAFDEWQADGYGPEAVWKAVELCRGKTDISRPGSITFKLRAQKAEVSQVQPLKNYTGYTDPNEGKYVPNPNPRRRIAG